MACHTAREILDKLVSSNSVGNARNFGSLLDAIIFSRKTFQPMDAGSSENPSNNFTGRPTNLT